ncbi:baseplate J/gp47 family protein [Aneurinibacillus migulanus]|uniref:baseplate J/gp47 family protein n=1 Tax=Aneurinibacillus migulanus TaxID=47500 RepID=UPI00209F5FD6|nr:baseplate J/gp47 family protein [Aneurinibacillus migulanus]MCP1354672.1 baseplate J/gp47 family protein [Aneurinibacillus migulanus]
MAFESQTKDAILQRMLFESPNDVDTRQGSVTWDVLSPSAGELENAYVSLGNVLSWGFANPEQPREYLEKRAAEFGVYPKPAVKATGHVTFTGMDGTEIPLGTEVLTSDTAPVIFVTTEVKTVIGGTATVAAEAKVGGRNGNVLAGAISLVGGNISGISSVTNESAFDGGADVESDEAFLNRYLEKVQKPATSGNVNHYVQWAKEVAGVYDAKCFPVWNGNGTVKVVLLDEDGTAPPQSTIDAVIAYINDGRIPIGADLTVVGATEVSINVNAKVTLTSGATLDGVKAEFEEILRSYFKSIAFVNTSVQYTRIAAHLLDVTNVKDYQNLTVNGGTQNIDIPNGSVPVLGTVTLT